MSGERVGTLEERDLVALAARCVELKRRIGRLTEELEAAKEELLGLGLDAGDSITVAGHRLLGCVRRRFAFSKEVEELQRELDARKDRELAEGRARLTSESLYVRTSRLAGSDAADDG